MQHEDPRRRKDSRFPNWLERGGGGCERKAGGCARKPRGARQGLCRCSLARQQAHRAKERSTDRRDWHARLPSRHVATASEGSAAIGACRRQLTRASIGDDRLQWLRSLPTQWRRDEMAVLHASPDDLWSAPLPDAPADGLESTYRGLGVPLVVYVHIHPPYVRTLPHLVLANSGSVSLSYDEDPRAAYVLINDGTPAIRRVEYDVEEEIEGLAERHYPYHEWLAAILGSGKYVPPSLEVPPACTPGGKRTL